MRSIECLKKDIQKENEVKHRIKETVSGLEEKRRFIESAIQKIQTSKTNNEIYNIHEDVKRKLQMLTLCQDDATENSNINDPPPTEELIRVEKVEKALVGLGLWIKQRLQAKAPIIISEIIPGSAADRHGGLKLGDRLLSINGISMENRSVRDAAKQLRCATGKVTLDVRYMPGALEDFKSEGSCRCKC
ncbi:unnamed protein product, partial [Meganyctiphanes norvegica]